MPNPGPQTQFVSTTANEVLYGGSAGGGKSAGLIALLLRWVHIPQFRALILRRETTQLVDVIDKANDLYKKVCPAAKYNIVTKTWRFPSGATARFNHCEHESDAAIYDGHEFQLCVARGTPIRMADGSYTPVEAVRVGDMVATLEGPKPVTRTHPPRSKACVTVSTDDGWVTVSEDHVLLTPSGWTRAADLGTSDASCQCPCECGGTTQSHGACKSEPCSRARCHTLWQTHESLRSGLTPQRAQAQSLPANPDRSASCASSAGGQSDCGASGGERQAQPQRRPFEVLLLPPSLPTRRAGADGLDRAQPGGLPSTELLGSHVGCPTCSGFGDALAPLGAAGAQESTPSQAGAACSCQRRLRLDGLASTPGHSQSEQQNYSHPYTNQLRPLRETGVRPSFARSVPAGVQEVWDLTVGDASHYVSLGGFISRNCEFDELTHFTEKQYRAIRARIRSSTPGLPRYSRATSNPGGEGHDWVFRRFGPWLDPSYEIEGRPLRYDEKGNKVPPAKPGEILWFISGERGEDVWVPKGTRDVDGNEAKSRSFIPARLSDNPRLVENDPGYAAALRDLDPVRRAQLKDGDWLIKPAKGLYFKRSHFAEHFVEMAPAKVRNRVRYWDRAATVDGDWTAGVRMSLTEEGIIYVEDVVRFRGEPGVVESNIKATATLDGPGVLQCLEQDPGSAGKSEIAYLIRALAGHHVQSFTKRVNKIVAAGPISSQSTAGNVRIVIGTWNAAFVSELEEFPEGANDDQVDGLSGGYTALLSTYAEPIRPPPAHISSTYRQGSGRGF